MPQLIAYMQDDNRTLHSQLQSIGIELKNSLTGLESRMIRRLAGATLRIDLPDIDPIEQEPVAIAFPPPDRATTNACHYTMCRAVTSTMQLWKEFEEGINGGPSINSLEAQHGRNWRPTE
ncbi:MAG: hypothetical protein ACREBR_04080, partial [bacterium]